MDLKIQCHCGSKYKFEFEPVDGRVPFQVICPTCGMDATDFANSQVQARTGAISATAPRPAMPIATSSVQSTTTAAPAYTPPAKSKLRVRAEMEAPAEAQDDSGQGSTAVAAPPVKATPAMLMPQAITPMLAQNQGFSTRFFLGLLGGLVGMLVGCLIWWAFVHFTGKNFRIVAVVVGITAGLGAKLFSKDEGSSELGSITGAFVLIGLVFTAYFIGRDRVHGFVGGIESTIYEEQVAYAKRAIEAVPTGSEEEIRTFLAKEEVLEDEKPTPETVSPNEVRMFRDVRLAQYKELATGKVSEKDYFKVAARWNHEESVADAKHAVAMMPTGSDREIRAYLAEQYAEYSDEKSDPNSIPQDEIVAFREQELPDLKALANGERPYEENLADLKTSKEALEDFEKTEAGGWTKFLYFFSGWGFGGLGILMLTLGLAYKIPTHAD